MFDGFCSEQTSRNGVGSKGENAKTSDMRRHVFNIFVPSMIVFPFLAYQRSSNYKLRI